MMILNKLLINEYVRKGAVEMNSEKLLDELYSLTLIEEERDLTEIESKRYLEIYEILKENNIDIEFGINI